MIILFLMKWALRDHNGNKQSEYTRFIIHVLTEIGKRVLRKFSCILPANAYVGHKLIRLLYEQFY